jgi:outer membrane lipoprotein-sorting protein
MPFQGQTKPEAMTADDVKDSQDELDVQGELVDYKAKGNKIEFLGKDDMEGTPCLKLKLTFKTGKEQTMYFDASNYYLLKTVAKVKANGKEMESVQTFSNYQKLPEGIFMPMVMSADGGEITFKSVEINKPVDDKIFKPNN